ncbi:MAG: DnaA/Hda family protein [Chloroflexota bacterium]
MRSKQTHEFRDRYRTVDVLINDIQFMAGKRSDAG